MVLVSTHLWAQVSDFQEPSKPDLLSTSSKALFSYDIVQERADELVSAVKRKTLGKYSENVLMFLPLVTGEIEFKVSELNFYHRAFSEKTGVEYVYKF